MSQPNLELANDEPIAAPSVLRQTSLWNPYLVLLAIAAGALLFAVLLLALELWQQYHLEIRGPLN